MISVSQCDKLKFQSQPKDIFILMIKNYKYEYLKWKTLMEKTH